VALANSVLAHMINQRVKQTVFEHKAWQSSWVLLERKCRKTSLRSIIDCTFWRLWLLSVYGCSHIDMEEVVEEEEE
jgi:hypothetical protein